MDKTRVLFVCVHNSARSQMAEAFLNKFGGEIFEAESAGLEPGTLNPNVVEVMKEIGFDISGNQTKSAFDFFKQGKRFDYVITVCDESAAEKCPIFPTAKQSIHWSFKDPSSLKGSNEEIISQTRNIRDEIKSSIENWVNEFEAA
jgi:arsenate reductase (thioredoxin)